MLPIPPPPPRYFVIVFFGTAAIAQWWVSCLSQKNSLWGLKKCANASPCDNTRTKNSGVAFSHKCKLKMPYSTGQYTSDLTINISNIYITITVLK